MINDVRSQVEAIKLNLDSEVDRLINYATDLENQVEDLKKEKEHLEEKLKDLEQNLKDNYRPIPVEEQYEISDRDFI